MVSAKIKGSSPLLINKSFVREAQLTGAEEPGKRRDIFNQRRFVCLHQLLNLLLLISSCEELVSFPVSCCSFDGMVNNLHLYEDLHREPGQIWLTPPHKGRVYPAPDFI